MFCLSTGIYQGGTLEDSEDPARGAIREAKEETGLDILNIRLFFQKANVDVSKNKQFITLVFHSKSSGVSVVVSPDEHDAFAWVEPSKVGNYKTVDYLLDCLQAYKELDTNPIN